jgi:hypothetical protein
MRGIYLSAAASVVWLAVLGGSRAAKGPRPTVLATLVLFVAGMGVDGFNGLLSDLGLWHLYVPTNVTRLLTGILAGASLGAGIAYVFALSMWAKPQPGKAVVEQLSDVAPPVLIAACLGFVAVLGLPSAYDLLTIGLVGAALVVFWVPAMVVIALFSGRSWFATRYSELDRMAVAGLILAVVMLAALAIFRSFAEQRLGLPNLT